MKRTVLLITTLLVMLLPRTIYAQQDSPVLTVKKLFTLLDQPKNLINEEGNCYQSTDGLDILKLNRPFVSRYLSYLKKTGLFSKAFLSGQEKYYEDLETAIKKDGLASARDADLYTQSQDPPTNKEILALLQKTDAIVSNNRATLNIDLRRGQKYQLIYKLVKENNSWLINDISVLF